MRKVAIDVEGDTVQADPALHPDADGCDLVLAPGTLRGPAHPDADPVVAPLALDPQFRKGADDPFLERRHESPHVRASPPQIKHDIGDPLARTVIGELPAAARCMNREARR